MNDILLSFIAATALSISLFIETSSWWVRVDATKNNFGYYISRSNIYLYGGRFFSLIFGLFIAFQIEQGVNPSTIAITLSGSFFLAFALQFLLLNSYFRRLVIIGLAVCLRLSPTLSVYDDKTRTVSKLEWPLFLGTLVASLSFSLGLSIPPLMASIFIDNRLVISNIGQLINAVGMIVILFFVDQKLYKAFDSGNLYCNLITYSKARSLAFLLISLMFLSIFVAMIDV